MQGPPGEQGKPGEPGVSGQPGETGRPGSAVMYLLYMVHVFTLWCSVLKMRCDMWHLTSVDSDKPVQPSF